MSLWPWGRKQDERKDEVAETVRAQEEALARLMRALKEDRDRDVVALLVGLVPVRRGPPK